MVKYVIKRLLIIPFLIIFVSMLIFFLVNLSRVDPAYTVLGASATVEQVAAFHERFGLDKPLVVQYLTYVKNAFKGDFGVSYFNGNSVISEIGRTIVPTLKLSITGLTISVCIGLLFGIFTAVKQYSAFDNIISFLTMLFTGMPNFLLALILMLTFSLKLKWLPSYGLSTPKHYILPIMTQLLGGLTMFIRFTRSAMLDTIRQDYIRTERSKGHSEKYVIFKVALRNAMLPIAAFIGDLVAGILGTTMIVEQVYSIPGLGQTVITAINRKDIPMVVGCVLFLSIYYIFVTVLVDVSFTLIDPRVKASFVSVAPTQNGTGTEKKSLTETDKADEEKK